MDKKGFVAFVIICALIVFNSLRIAHLELKLNGKVDAWIKFLVNHHDDEAQQEILEILREEGKEV